MHPTRIVVRRLAFLALTVLLLGTSLGIACKAERQSAAPSEGGGAPEVATTAMTRREDDGDPGIFDDQVRFGQSAAFT